MADQKITGQDQLGLRATMNVGERSYDFFNLEGLQNAGHDIAKLPKSIKVLLENLARHEDGRTVHVEDIKKLADWATNRTPDQEIAYRPARVLMQDFTGVPAVVDLAAMRDAVTKVGADPQRINPLAPVDLVIDHSVMVDHFASEDAMERNEEVEYARNGERYSFLRWGQTAFNNFRWSLLGQAFATRSTLNILRKPYGRPTKMDARLLILTPWWAQIPTQQWSTEWASLVGVLAALKLKLPCLASRFPCWSLMLLASVLQAQWLKG